MKNRVDYVDALRVFACFLVVLTHSQMPSIDGSDGIYLFGISFICSPNNSLFFAISGALLLPVKESMGEFYKRRFTKLIPPMVIWSIIGGGLEYLCGRFTAADWLHRELMMTHRPVIGVYWFLYVMIGLYLIAPIISKWLREATKRELQFVLLLWCITLLWPYHNILIGTNFVENGSHYATLNYFGGFLGYWLLGHYLMRYPVKIGWNWEFMTPSIILIAHTAYILFTKLNGGDAADLITNLQIGSAAMVVLIFTIFQNTDNQVVSNRGGVFCRSYKDESSHLRDREIFVWNISCTHMGCARYNLDTI